MPDEHETLYRAIELGQALPRRPDPPLVEMLPFLVRTSSKIAMYLQSTAAEASVTHVKLTWDEAAELLLSDGARARASAMGAVGDIPALLPLADWRARAIPGMLDLAFAILRGDPGDPDRLAALARASDDRFFPTLRDRGLLIMPTTEIWNRGRLRGVECALSDPISTALANGAATASFPNLPGWSARDCALRALAEHRGWLEPGSRTSASGLPCWAGESMCPELTELSGLLTAARAAIFADTLWSGVPELPLTAAAIASRMSDYGPGARAAAEAAYEALVACHSQPRPPDPRTVRALRHVVHELPGYARPTPPVMHIH